MKIYQIYSTRLLIIIFSVYLTSHCASATTTFFTIEDRKNKAPIDIYKEGAFFWNKDEIIYQAAPGELLPTNFIKDIDSFHKQKELIIGESKKEEQDIYVKKNDQMRVAIAGSEGIPVYLDIPKDKERTIFANPGETWDSCEKKAKDPLTKKEPCNLAWPKNSPGSEVKLSAIDSKLVKFFNPERNREEWGLFYQLNYSYKKKNGKIVSGTGWMSSEYLSRKPQIWINDDIVPDSDDGDDALQSKTCPNQKSTHPTKDNSTAEALSKLNTGAKKTYSKNIFNDIKNIVGFCPSKTGIVDILKWDKNLTTFDQVIAPIWREKLESGAIPELYSTSGERISKVKLIAIDALARTIYGEMSRCQKNGIEYLQAVASYAFNRAEVTKNLQKDNLASPFATFPANVSRDPITQVAIHPGQFSIWNKQNNPNIIQAFCPPGDGKHKMWTGGLPSNNEKEIWDDSLKVAIDTVLNPEKFCKKTKHHTSLFYTSGIAQDSQIFEEEDEPNINGRLLTRDKCIRSWKLKTDTGNNSDDFAKKVEKYSCEMKCKLVSPKQAPMCL